MTSFTTIGIDPALTNLGLYWLSVDTDGGETVTTQEKLIRTGSLRGGERLAFIYAEAESFFTENAAELVVLEDYNYKGHNLAEMGEATGILKMLAHQFEVRLLTASPALVKKFATGSTQASKERMMARYHLANEHLADARALAELGAVILGRPTERRCEKEAARQATAARQKARRPKAPYELDKPTVAL